jgi:hypothetical protein
MNSQKLAAYKASKTTIGPWADLEVFENVGLAFNNKPPNFQLRQPLTVAECAVTVDSLRQCRVVTFTEDVKRYIAACAAEEEFMYLPDPLTFSMPYLCERYYFCSEHGGVEVDDLIDGQCDTCTGRYEDGRLIDAPLYGLKGRGINITRFSAYDYAPIATKYDALVSLDMDTVRLDMSTVDIQVARLLDVNSYRKKRRAQLDTQLLEVSHG